jgi:hypothetical protein
VTYLFQAQIHDEHVGRLRAFLRIDKYDWDSFELTLDEGIYVRNNISRVSLSLGGYNYLFSRSILPELEEVGRNKSIPHAHTIPSDFRAKAIPRELELVGRNKSIPIATLSHLAAELRYDSFQRQFQRRP